LKILVTGGTGFVGSALISQLLDQGHKVIAAIRSLESISTQVVNGLEYVVVGNIDGNTDWSVALAGVDCVIHCAGRSHVINETEENPLETFRQVNVDGTHSLAVQAMLFNIKRLVFLSSIKVNGEVTHIGKLFKPDDYFSSNDAYAISKYEAELGLLKVVQDSLMEVVIIRPPIVYGPNVKANFERLIKLIKKEFPLPFGMINNKRSFIAIDNLVDFILLCADCSKSPKAANQIFLVSDGEDVSTTTLLRKVARAYCAKVRLIPVPVSLLRLGAKVRGRSDLADRLFGNLQVDPSKACELLGWKPVVTMDEQLKKMAECEKSEIN